jgi:hypothetical protein
MKNQPQIGKKHSFDGKITENVVSANEEYFCIFLARPTFGSILGSFLGLKGNQKWVSQDLERFGT